jgi:hypothetical protein
MERWRVGESLSICSSVGPQLRSYGGETAAEKVYIRPRVHGLFPD